MKIYKNKEHKCIKTYSFPRRALLPRTLLPILKRQQERTKRCGSKGVGRGSNVAKARTAKKKKMAGLLGVEKGFEGDR